MSFISKSALTHEKSIDIHCLDSFFELKVLREVIQTKEKKITPFFLIFNNSGQPKSGQVWATQTSGWPCLLL